LLHLPKKKYSYKTVTLFIAGFYCKYYIILSLPVDYWILKGFSPRINYCRCNGQLYPGCEIGATFPFCSYYCCYCRIPAFASGNELGFNKDLKKMIGRVLLSNIAACAAMLIAGRWLFTFLYGNSFSLMYMCFVYSVPAILAITVVRILASYFARNKQDKI